MINSNWQKVLIDVATKHIINSSGQKRFIEGPGSYQDPNGNKNISGPVIVRPWRSSGGWSFLFFAVLWSTISTSILFAVSNSKNVVVNGVSYHTVGEALSANPGVYIFGLFPIIGLFLLYVAISKMVNKTTFSVSGTELSVEYTPLPWPKSVRKYSKNDITQIYVQQQVNTSDGNTTRSFRVVAQFKNGPEEIIESGYNNYSDAKILEQWLETKLNLQDVSVAGEVGT